MNMLKEMKEKNIEDKKNAEIKSLDSVRTTATLSTDNNIKADLKKINTTDSKKPQSFRKIAISKDKIMTNRQVVPKFK